MNCRVRSEDGETSGARGSAEEGSGVGGLGKMNRRRRRAEQSGKYYQSGKETSRGRRNAGRGSTEPTDNTVLMVIRGVGVGNKDIQTRDKQHHHEQSHAYR
jgi:hypothetical protein